ncbi:MAG: MFS transporter [Phycisphaerales bacterium]|nr:MFS transporter [Phycisphaerales bacterium]
MLLLLINLFNYIDRYILAAVAPEIGEEFFGVGEGADPAANFKLGLLSTAFLVTYMVAAPVFGWMGDRWRRWVIIGLGVIAWSLATGASGIAWTFGMLLACRVFVGLGEAAYGPIAPTVISDLYPVSKRGAVLSWFYVAIPVGSALGYLLGGVLAKAWGSWHGPFIIMMAPGLALGVVCFFMREPARGLADGVADAKVEASRKMRLRDCAVLARTPSFVYNTVGMTAMTFAVGGIGYWMPKFASERAPGEMGMEKLAHVNMVFGAITVVAGLTATIAGGYLADRLRARWGGSYFLVSGIGMLISAPFVVLSLYAPYPMAWWMMFIGMFFLFIGTGPTNTVLANVTHPGIRASAFAINIFLIHTLGDAISPPLMGWIKDRTGSWDISFFVCAGMIVAGGIAWMLGARYLKRDTDRVSGGGEGQMAR